MRTVFLLYFHGYLEQPKFGHMKAIVPLWICIQQRNFDTLNNENTNYVHTKIFQSMGYFKKVHLVDVCDTRGSDMITCRSFLLSQQLFSP